MTAAHPRVPPAPPAPAFIDGIDVVAVAAAVAGCAGVSGLDSGRFGEVASYLPGRQVPGVIVRRQAVLIRVRARWGLQVADLLSQITAAVAPVTGGCRVQVVVGDIDDPPAPVLPSAAGPAPGLSLPGPARRARAAPV
ncbi:MAG: hypothetical protein QOJ73_7626 [Streptosporangiaceae bacterium]|jgi:hypothetical protein|nr:hypothetical protein [Streptosporangiaceae bacterium]